MIFKAACISKTGGRSANEDFCSYAVAGDQACYLVADGLGGHRGGALASKTAGEAVLKAFRDKPAVSGVRLKEYIYYAREELQKAERTAESALSLKTTLVVLLVDRQKALWAHVGDSRLYLFKKGKLSFQTRDHSVPQRLAESGEISIEDIRFHEDRNRLIAAFTGEDDKACVYSEDYYLAANDAFLLCTDGFWEYVYEKEMERTLIDTKLPERWLESMESLLLKRIDSGSDNYSALAVIC